MLLDLLLAATSSSSNLDSSENPSEETVLRWTGICLAHRIENAPSSDKMLSDLMQLGLPETK